MILSFTNAEQKVKLYEIAAQIKQQGIPEVFIGDTPESCGSTLRQGLNLT